ncbi:MAG: hypothetical protein KDA28_16935, partial [Phycisphaerales bacterium]|nr:hypothetical protein [Phycisphaerales bacterium]
MGLAVVVTPAAGQTTMSVEHRVQVLEQTVRFGEFVAEKPLPVDACSVERVLGDPAVLAAESDLVRERLDALAEPCDATRHSTLVYNRIVLDSIVEESPEIRLWISTTRADHHRRSRLDFRMVTERPWLVGTEIGVGAFFHARPPESPSVSRAAVLGELGLSPNDVVVDSVALAYFEPAGYVMVLQAPANTLRGSPYRRFIHHYLCDLGGASDLPPSLTLRVPDELSGDSCPAPEDPEDGDRALVAFGGPRPVPLGDFE